MEPNEVLAHLKKVPMFWDLEEEGEQELLRLVPHVEEHSYDIGDVLLREEEIPNKTVMIVEGRVQVTCRVPGQAFDIQDLGAFAGEWLNECSGPEWCDGADINTNEGVNFTD